MKFGSVIRNPQSMRDMHNIFTTLTKLTKECIMDIQPDLLVLSVSSQQGSNSVPLVCIQLSPSHYFSQYTMENKDLDDDGSQHIMLSLSSAFFGRALAVLKQNPKFCVMKLSGIPFTSLRIEGVIQSNIDGNERKRLVTHDIPVSLISREDWSYYMVPTVPKSAIALKIPSDRKIRHLIDKLKNLSPKIIFHASAKGNLNIIAETEKATITTHYNDLRVMNDNEVNEKTESKCVVDCKKIAHFFSSLQMATQTLICGISADNITLEINSLPSFIINATFPAVCDL